MKIEVRLNVRISSHHVTQRTLGKGPLRNERERRSGFGGSISSIEYISVRREQKRRNNSLQAPPRPSGPQPKEVQKR